MKKDYSLLTVVIPAKNEEQGLKRVLPSLVKSGVGVIVVDDGSTDNTAAIASQHGVKVISHRFSKGNGAAVKTGLRAVETKYVGLMDADGQHSVEGMLRLFRTIKNNSADLVVGTRSRHGQASVFRWFANQIYNKFSSVLVGSKVLDLTSGQRVFLSSKIKPIISLLPNGFSYPTTSTMIFYRMSYHVLYESVEVDKRIGKSHIKLFRDGFRFLLIITKIGTLYSPFKLFVPTSLVLMLLGLIRYIYTYSIQGTFTNMSATLFVAALIVFLMGVLSEQLTISIFSSIEDKTDGD